jgi:hypothetical protein
VNGKEIYAIKEVIIIHIKYTARLLPIFLTRNGQEWKILI